MDDFISQFRRKTKELRVFHLYNSPSELIRCWSKFVKEVHDSGYDDFLVEYDNDVSIRNTIEKILQSSDFDGYDEFHLFKEEVKKLDKIIMDAFSPEVKRKDAVYWWQQGIFEKRNWWLC